MTNYVNPNSDAYAIGGYQFFRLNTILSCPGDIFESKQSGHAFAVGPESDVANVSMAYFDDQISTFMNQTQIGPNRAWNGRIDARNEAKYAPGGRPGRIMMWAADLYDPNYLPTGYSVNADNLIRIEPRIDVIEYFAPTGIVPARNDRTFRFQDVPLPINGDKAYLVLPYWGRKSASCRITNLASATVTWTLSGVNYYMNDTGAGLETQLDTGTVAQGAQRLFVLKEGTHGMFDALMVRLSTQGADAPAPIEIITSDIPVG